MNDKIKLPFNDVFFYGVSLNSRDVSDIRTDIFANILMRYLRTLKPVSSKLYRTADGNKYEYNYAFIPSKPLSWRVIKNRRIIEEIEQLSDGKYCLNYYDEQGRDVKRVLFSKQHRWQKTNYYNSISGNDLFYSLVPKEVNGETAILQYITGETYPVTLYCCPAATCQEVLNNVLDRVPTPEATALTNYGVLYFAQEETCNIFKQILSEEEEKYAQLHKPEVFTTEEDVAGGFCFDVSSFDSTKPVVSMFNLSEADELSEEGFDLSTPALSMSEDNEEAPAESKSGDFPIFDDVTEEGEYSLDSDISEAIRLISDATDVHIDEFIVFAETGDGTSGSDFFTEPIVVATSEAEKPHQEQVIEVVTENSETQADTPAVSNVESFVFFDDIPSLSDETETAPEEIEVAESADESSITPDTFDDVDLLAMNDEDIDDYVQTLIDSLLLDAKSVAELKDSSDNAFTAGRDEVASEDTDNARSTIQDLVTETPADSVIESNGSEYFYYGETDEQGKRTGKGKTLMSDGKTAYDGEYKDDMRHGTGSFYYKDGSLCYWGQWEENLRNGFGVGVSSETGTVHMGTWLKNKPSGVGVRFDKDGNFMYIDSACHRTNGGIRITGFTDNSFTVEYWDENTLRTVKKEISLEDLI